MHLSPRHHGEQHHDSNRAVFSAAEKHMYFAAQARYFIRHAGAPGGYPLVGAGRGSVHYEVAEVADSQSRPSYRCGPSPCRPWPATTDRHYTSRASTATINRPTTPAGFTVVSSRNNAETGGRNRLLFSNAAKPPRPASLTVRLSYDEGKTSQAARVWFAGQATYLPDSVARRDHRLPLRARATTSSEP